MIRKVKRIISSERDDIADLHTRRALPTPALEMIDPFLFLNHHGPQFYPSSNQGLPFGPHPHRGFETVTLILEGDILHRDSGGHESVIRSGGVQWMTAGKGLVHSEESSPEFKQKGGPLEILQLWVNLPKKLKMTAPKYIGLQDNEIPEIILSSQVSMKLVAGRWPGVAGAFSPFLDLSVMLLSFDKEGEHNFKIAPDYNIFFYVIRGEFQVNGETASSYQTVEFSSEGNELTVKASSAGVILLCYAPPINEPVVSYGPFVMNTREDIMQAISDYQAGKFEGVD